MTRTQTDKTRTELDAATRALIAAPASSLADIADAVGLSRTTLHRRYPTRADLLHAIAVQAIDRLHDAQQHAGFTDTGDPGKGSFEVLTDSLIELAPHLQLVLASSEVNEPSLAAAITELDAPVLRAIRHGQSQGTLRPDLPADWILESLYALSIAASGRVQAGALARRDATPLVIRTWTVGCHTPPA
jgi:AcrR family transcriptional regulator